MKNQQKDIKLELIASTFQIERDNMAYLVVTEREMTTKLLLMDTIIDFDAIVLKSLIPMFLRMRAIDFLIKHHMELSGRFSIESLLSFCDMFNFFDNMKIEPRNLSSMKRMYSSVNFN